MMKTITLNLADGTTISTSATNLAAFRRAIRKASKRSGVCVYAWEKFNGKLEFTVEQYNTCYTAEDMRVNGWKREIEFDLFQFQLLYGRYYVQ